jgi:hypothetical protein
MLSYGDTVKFKSGTGLRADSDTRFRYEGCMEKRGGGRIEYVFMALDGAKEGGTYRVTLVRSKSILDYVAKVRKQASDAAKAEAVVAAKHALEDKGINSLQGVEPGDLITVTITGKRNETYDFKVYEVDYRALRIKGFRPFQDPGTKKGWISVAHRDVSFQMKTKKSFDPRTDSQAQLHQDRAQATNERRQATKRRRAELRSIFG